jgi:hypothetical protein
MRRVTYAQHALSADQFDELVLNGTDSIALGIGLDVAQVTDMAHGVSRGTVGLSVGVD